MRLTKRRIQFGERRDLVLKGKAGTIPGYPATGIRERFGERWETSEAATPLVGRERELLALLDAWIRAQGGDGQLVTLVGDAGVGKSRLITEMLEKVGTSTTLRVVRGRCLSYGQEISLWLVGDLLRTLFSIREQDVTEEVGVKLRAGVAGLLGSAAADVQAETLDVLGEVLGLPPGQSGVTHAGAQIRRQSLIRNLRLVLGILSERAPTIVVLEDLHWLDAASGEVLTEVLSDVPGLRLLVVAAQRPGWSAPWTDWGWTERITLRPLRDDEAAQLAGAVLGGTPLSAELLRYVADRAGGNPFFVEEMLRALEEAGDLIERDGRTVLAPGAAERLPSTLTEVLLARLDRLESDTRSVAQVASVIGRSFAVRLLAEVVGREQAALEAPLTALQRAEIAFPRRGSDVEYAFKHVSMREVAYNTLLQRRRQELHLQTARAISALYASDEYVEMIAYHYARTEEHAEAADWMERAGDRAAAIYANETAIANYEEARRRADLCGLPDLRIAALDEKLGSVLVTAARYDEAVPVLERAIEVYRSERDLEAAGRSTAYLGVACVRRGTVDEGIARVQPMVELLQWSGPSPALASLHIALARLFQNRGTYRQTLEEAERASEVARAIGSDQLLGEAEERRGSALSFLGRADESQQALETAIPLLQEVGNLGGLQLALSNMGEAHRLRGDLVLALRFNEQALDASEKAGDLASAAFTLVNLGEILIPLGDWEQAQNYLERARDVSSSMTSASYVGAYLPLMSGRLGLATGDWDDAERSLEEAAGIALRTADRQALEYIAALLSELDILRGRPESARERLVPLVEEPDAGVGLLLPALAWALRELGELDRGLEVAEEALRRTKDQRELLHSVEALRVRALILGDRGDVEAAQASIDEGLQLARSMPYPYAEARLLFQSGELSVSRAAGASPEGRARLEEALSIFRRLGAKKHMERTEAALAELVPS